MNLHTIYNVGLAYVILFQMLSSCESDKTQLTDTWAPLDLEVRCVFLTRPVVLPCREK